MFIYQDSSWPDFEWNHKKIEPLLGRVRNLQGKLIGRMELIGFDLRNEASLQILTTDVIKSNEIEGEFLPSDQVRSSIAQQLGLDLGGEISISRDIEGVVEMTLDAIQGFDKKLTFKRLYGWHASLFPTGFSGLLKISVGKWRNDSKGPMQVISGGMGKEKIHFQAPDSTQLSFEMKQFISWFNTQDKLDPVLKSAIAHLWFVTIHPFEDGNGRIARALTDLLLARADNIPQRFYSMSSQIQLERKKYYNTLELTQKGDTDITIWLEWFLECLEKSLIASKVTLDKVLKKYSFWNEHAKDSFNKRQVKMLELLMNDFEGNLTSSKWAKLTKSSPDSALRDITNLIDRKILEKDKASGRSTNYLFVYR